MRRRQETRKRETQETVYKEDWKGKEDWKDNGDSGTRGSLIKGTRGAGYQSEQETVSTRVHKGQQSRENRGAEMQGEKRE